MRNRGPAGALIRKNAHYSSCSLQVSDTHRAIFTRMNTFFILSAKYLYVVPVAVLGIYFFTRSFEQQKRMALFAIPAVLLAYVLARIGNHFYMDPRPFVVGHFTPLIYHAPDNGFPSDHTLLVATLAAIGTLWNRKLGLVLWAIAILVAVARVYVGVHHAIDVVGSMVIAIIAVFIVYVLFKRIFKKEVR